MAAVLPRFLWNARTWPFADRRELFFLSKRSLTFQFEPKSTMQPANLPLPFNKRLKKKIKCGVQVKHYRDFVWLCSYAFSHLYIGRNYVPQLVPLALMWMKTWPRNLRIKILLSQWGDATCTWGPWCFFFWKGPSDVSFFFFIWE